VLVGTRRIGVWHWELPVFPVRWAKAFEHVDELWAPSAFIAQSVRQASDIPVRLVPHAVPSAPIAQKLAREVFDLPASAFVFLTIFDSNSFPARKNPLGVIRAFQNAFPDRSSDHLLIVKSHGRGRRSADFDEILRLAQGDRRLVLLDQVFSEERTRLLQAACDVYVSLHRSEGYGLNLLECMAQGKLAIGTAFSGNLQFMSPENSVLIPYSMRQVDKGEYLFGEGQWWAEPEHDTAVEALRWAAAGGGDVQARVGQGRSDATGTYSFQAIGRVAAAAWRGQLNPY
jgi:glycosyltransferase involved in cell wall biosynthesis